MASHDAEYKICDTCHKAYQAAGETSKETEAGEMSVQHMKEVHEKANIFGYQDEMPSVCIPIGRICRLFYSYLAVPSCAIFSVVAMALYGMEMLDKEKFLPGQLCFAWFVIFTILCCAQLVIWMVIFIPARYSKDYFLFISKTPLGKILRREAFYVALNKCQYAMLCFVSIECLFLTVAQHALIDNGSLNQNFGILMGVPCLIHLIIFLVRLLAWSQESFDDMFYMPWWDLPIVPHKKLPYYEYELSATFEFVASAYGAADLMMGIFAAAVTYGLTEYTSKTDKVYQFFQTFHPCVLIDHYPASLVGLFIIGIREVIGIFFNLMLLVFVYLRAGPLEVIWGFAVISVAQILCVVIVNAFSAQLYTEDDLDTTLANWKGLTEQDLLNVRAHTLSYCIWLAGMIILFAFQFRMMYRYNIPFGNGSLGVRVFWHVFFVVGMIFTISMTAAMIVAITTLSMDWTEDPTSFIQIVIGFMFNKLQGKYLMLMVAPAQRRMFPPDLGLKMRVTANPARGKFGILGRSENVLSIAFWALGFLVFGTYLLDDNVDSGTTLFPLARGFRIKPPVYVFAPAWFLVCMVFAYAVFLKVQEAAGSGASPFRVLAIKVIGLILVFSALMCLFVTIPLWEKADFVTIVLVVCFPMWFFVSQGFTVRCVVYNAIYTVLTVLSALKDQAPQMNVICSVILLVQLMAYPCCFRRADVRLYMHFEVLSQRRVVGHHAVEKNYEMVPIEGGGAYAERSADYAEAEAKANDKANREAGEAQRANVEPDTDKIEQIREDPVVA